MALVIILAVVLVFTIMIAIVLFLVYTKRVKRKLEERIAKRQAPESDGYDDIDLTNYDGKQLEDTYDIIAEEDKGYAEPYSYESCLDERYFDERYYCTIKI